MTGEVLEQLCAIRIDVARMADDLRQLLVEAARTQELLAEHLDRLKGI
jgi:hypothetical protein